MLFLLHPKKRILWETWFLCHSSISHKSYSVNQRLRVHLQCGVLLLCADTIWVPSWLPWMQLDSVLDAAVFYYGAGHVAVNEQDCMNNVLFIQRLDKNECPQHLRTSNLHHFLCTYSSWSFNYLSLERIWQLEVVTTQQVNPTNTRTSLHFKYIQVSHGMKCWFLSDITSN